jgi:SAM-dependent methyltransferase
MSMSDPTKRFSDRADDYARARPGYPDAVFDAIAELTGLAPGSVVADVGSGTGISAAPLLRRGCAVRGVEPNAAMRAAAERALAGEPRFTSVDGTAERTTLPDASVDLALVAQAFHWMDPARTRRELARVLRPPRHVALLWNWRRPQGGAFTAAFEAVVERWSTDYDAVKRRYRVRESLGPFFGGAHETRTFEHAHPLDRAAARALLLSSSYTPAEGHPDRAPMLRALDDAFDAHARGGVVEVAYDAELHVGRLTWGG